MSTVLLYYLHVEWGWIMQIDVEALTVEVAELEKVLFRSLVLMWYGADYASSTLDIYVTAVVARINDLRQVNLRDSVEIRRLVEGIKRKQGCATRKKLPVEGAHVAALMGMGAPNRNGHAWTGTWVSMQWLQLVAMVVLGWSAFLRCSEVLELQLCDLLWVKQRLEVCVRKAKADQLGFTATTELEYALDGDSACLVSFLDGYIDTVLGGAARGKGCTKGTHQGYECPVCPWLFPAILKDGVHMRQTSDTNFRRRLKAAFVRLAEAGHISESDVQSMSAISLRKGGNSTAAAAGTRDVLREKHGRWGQTARKRAAGTAEVEYNMQLEDERGAVMRALQDAVDGKGPKTSLGERRDSGASVGFERPRKRQKRR